MFELVPDKTIAYHEAGHCVAILGALEQGHDKHFKIKQATIIPQKIREANHKEALWQKLRDWNADVSHLGGGGSVERECTDRKYEKLCPCPKHMKDIVKHLGGKKPTFKLLEWELNIALAGPAVTSEMTGLDMYESFQEGGSSDAKNAMMLLAAMTILTGEGKWDKGQIEAVTRDRFEKTRRYIKRHWDTVEAIGDALVAAHILSGDMIHAISKDTWKGGIKHESALKY